MVITYSRVWINRVRLPILLVVSWTGKMNIPLSPCVPENLVSRDGFSRPVPRQPAHLHTQAESGAYLRDYSRVPRRRPFMKPPLQSLISEILISKFYTYVCTTMSKRSPSICAKSEIGILATCILFILYYTYTVLYAVYSSNSSTKSSGYTYTLRFRYFPVCSSLTRTLYDDVFFQHAHFIPIVGVRKRGVNWLVHGDLPRQHSFGTTLRTTDPVLADSRQCTPSVRIAWPDKLGTDPLAYGGLK